MASKKQVQQQSTDIGSFPGVVQFEPCSTPVSKKRGLKEKEDKPTYTLRHDDNRVFVYGLRDCQVHGDSSLPRRLNSFDRYNANEDYLNQLKVEWLHLFASYRGQGDPLQPTGVLSVPVAIYNYRDETTGENTILNNMTAMLTRQTEDHPKGHYHTMEDVDGCSLKVRILPKRIRFLPESTGALYHFAHDHTTLTARPNVDVSGNVVVGDIGFLTTDFTKYINMVYQREEAYTEGSLGMSRIVYAIRTVLEQSGHTVDISEIDAGLRLIAGSELGSPKFIMINGAYPVDISSIYDPMIADLVHAFCDAFRNLYKTKIRLLVLAGGGAYHLAKLIAAELKIPVVVCPNPAVANVLGGMTYLRIEARNAGVAPTLFWCVDGGNGGFKGVSSETLRLSV